jgi:transposase
MRTYEEAFKTDAVKLAGEIGVTKTSKELGIPSGTLDTWINKAKKGILPDGTSTPKRVMNLAEENKRLQQENRELRRTNEILSKAAAFFAQIEPERRPAPAGRFWRSQNF